MTQPRPLTPVERALRLLEQYRLLQGAERPENLRDAPALKKLAYKSSITLVQIVDQLRLETRRLSDWALKVHDQLGADDVLTSEIPFGDLGTCLTVITALLAERSRLLTHLDSIAKVLEEK